MKILLDSRFAIAGLLARHFHLIALGLFGAAGLAVLDDYGIAADEGSQRGIGIASIKYALGDEDALPTRHGNRWYPVAYEAPLVGIELALGLEDFRDIYLVRHLVTHLFFLTGGFFAWLLTYRLFGSRLVALFAMLIFLLHPRLYAHSFFNTKDLPFLSMFMVALYLVHRAFRRESVWSFVWAGAGAALLTNMRIMGIMLFPAVLGMLALDAFRAARRGDGRADAKGALFNAGAFAAVYAAVLYAAWPLLWRDPTNLFEALGALSSPPTRNPTLFRGEWVRWPNIPWDFIPSWMAATTPPAALILAALGGVRVARLCLERPRAALFNSNARFGLLMVACLVSPVAAALALNTNMYTDWRQAYFIYAPTTVLAAFGLRRLWSLGKPRVRAGAMALAALGIAAAGVQTVALHPYQNEYFNPLADKDRLGERWEMDYWRVSYREALEKALETQPEGRVFLSFPTPEPTEEWLYRQNLWLIPPDERRRLSYNAGFPSFHIVRWDGGDAAFWKREVYGVPLVSLVDVRAESESAFREAYEAALSAERAAVAGGFDIYRAGDSLTYINEDCGEEDTLGTFQLVTVPSRRSDRTAESREPIRFDWRDGATFGGKCLISVPLPDYPIHSAATEKWIVFGEGSLWRTVIPFADSLSDYESALSAASGGAPDAAGGGFEMRADGDTLTYVKRGCSEEDRRGRFFLSVFPSDRADLPAAAREAGREHEAFNFDFASYGAALGGDCVIIRALPDYAISHVETGKWIPGGGDLWKARIAVGD